MIQKNKHFWWTITYIILGFIISFILGWMVSSENLKDKYRNDLLSLCQHEAVNNNAKGFMFIAESEECVFIHD